MNEEDLKELETNMPPEDEPTANNIIDWNVMENKKNREELEGKLQKTQKGEF